MIVIRGSGEFDQIVRWEKGCSCSAKRFCSVGYKIGCLFDVFGGWSLPCSCVESLFEGTFRLFFFFCWGSGRKVLGTSM
jgi:hypothetical protein